MNSTPWFDRVFGDPKQVAVRIVFEQRPDFSSERSAESLGRFGLVVGDCCVTRHEIDRIGVSDDIRWDPLVILQWLAKRIVEHANEEGLPVRTSLAGDGEEVLYTAGSWYVSAQHTLRTARDDEWDLIDERISAWREAHGLQWATTGLSLPPVFVRRLGEDIEVSWETGRLAAKTPGTRFLAPPGAALLSPDAWIRTLTECLETVHKVWQQATGRSARLDLARHSDPWRLLLPPSLRKPGILPETLEDSLSLATRSAKYPGRWARHTWQTQLLGALPPDVSSLDVVSVLRWAESSDAPIALDVPLSRYAHPTRAPQRGAWQEGYEAAKRLRSERALGLGEGPILNLGGFLRRKLGVDVNCGADLPRSIQGAALWSPTAVPQVVVRGDESRQAFSLATELGHLLLDERLGDTIAWASTDYSEPAHEARARAFAAMLLMPESAINRHPAARPDLSIADLTSMANDFGVTLRTAALHLQNLKVISKQKRSELERVIPAT